MRDIGTSPSYLRSFPLFPVGSLVHTVPSSWQGVLTDCAELCPIVFPTVAIAQAIRKPQVTRS